VKIARHGCAAQRIKRFFGLNSAWADWRSAIASTIGFTRFGHSSSLFLCKPTHATFPFFRKPKSITHEFRPELNHQSQKAEIGRQPKCAIAATHCEATATQHISIRRAPSKTMWW
jgi:hypothetical protein